MEKGPRTEGKENGTPERPVKDYERTTDSTVNIGEGMFDLFNDSWKNDVYDDAV